MLGSFTPAVSPDNKRDPEGSGTGLAARSVAAYSEPPWTAGNGAGGSPVNSERASILGDL